ncbi:BolA-like protein 2 [Trachymyrmex septentrionalis]|uniref:BolA-like protein 2 n=1 Tax=Trachymyrmex septentrionalis TaxID=34720 RepID=A0A195FQF3_9HYME|nr:BolA-like protein 2 [Trachymyrmex septentrionalis]
MSVDGFRKILFVVHCVLQEVVDQSDGCGAKFSVFVVSDLFQGKPLLIRHRLVYGVLEEELKTIHAISLTTLTPEQWEKTKN